MKPDYNMVDKLVREICRRAGYKDDPETDYLSFDNMGMLMGRFNITVGPKEGQWTAWALADEPILDTFNVLESTPSLAVCMCLIRRDEARFHELSDFLHEIGWRDSCDAQNTELRKAIPELHMMLTHQIFGKGGTLWDLVELIEQAAPYIRTLNGDEDFVNDWMARAKKHCRYVK